MAWIQLELDVPDTLKDALIGALADQGIAGVWESGEPRAAETHLVIYAEAANATDLQRAIESFFERNDWPAIAIARHAVTERDWSEEWRKSYTSFRIGERFFVVPSWRDDEAPAGCLRPIRIDPGEAFGSGIHETTQMTMEALEHLASEFALPEPILDLGAGSGILAIGAHLLGAKTVAACDNDPVAVGVAAENAERNGVADMLFFTGSVDAIATASIGLMLANLTADVIALLFPEIDRALRPSGTVIFSGILTHQGEDIRTLAATSHYSIQEERARGEWIALVFRKHGA